MKTYAQLQFIKQKISDINVALLHFDNTSVLTIPNTIVNTYSVDEYGNIYFFLNRPRQLLCEFEKEFPVVLQYFKKGISYYLQIEGFARIICDPEELHCYDLTQEQIQKALTTEAMVKVVILKAHYYDKNSVQSFFTKIKSAFYNLLTWVEPNVKSFNFARKRHPNPHLLALK